MDALSFREDHRQGVRKDICIIKFLSSNYSTKGIMKLKVSHEFVRRQFNGIIESK
jgi:hypothetical protein